MTAKIEKRDFRRRQRKTILKRMANGYQLYLFILPALVYFLVFKYWPMYGAQIAFKKYMPGLGIWQSEWVGFKHFIRFFNSYNFWVLLRNTITLNLYQLAVGFPIPIILALMINEVGNKGYKKTIQMITYAPHFISTVVIVGMINIFLNEDRGLINNIMAMVGLERINFMMKPEWFKTIYVFSGVWQNAGWGTIIFLAALSGIDPMITEAAIIDGTNRFQRIRYINLPGIMPTIVILLIMRIGRLLNIGFEKVLLLQNGLNVEASDVISTYVYRVGIQGGQYSFSAAVGIFNAVVNLILLISVNKIAKSVSETSLW